MDPQKRFAGQLSEVHMLAGAPKLSAVARCAPAVLSRSSLSTLLRGEFTRAPRWEVVWAFVAACHTLGADQSGNLPRALADLTAEQVWRDRYRALVQVLEMLKVGAARTEANTPAEPSVSTAPPGPAAPAGVGVTGGSHQHQAAGRPVVALRYRFGSVPPRAGAFQDRDATRRVAGIVDRGDTVVLTSGGPVSTSVLSGLGGVGKTQLAVDYAEHLWNVGEIELLVWITADSREAIVSGYARLAEDLTGVEDPQSEHGAQRLLAWLAASPLSWLVVLDDLQSPRDLDGLWPLITLTGRVVVTTRRRDAALQGHRRQLVEIGVFTESEANAYLDAALTDHPHLLAGAAELARDLGLLPLALAQAAAYMLDLGLSCADYRERLADQRRRLSSLLPEVDGLPDQHRATVAATWLLSIEHADQMRPVGVARPLLELASVLDPNGIPAAVFGATVTLEMLAQRVGHAVSGEQAWEGVACLHRLSLVTRDSTSPSQAVRVHALVQRAVRDTVPRDGVSVLAQTAADALVQVWPEVERDTQLAQVLRANADSVATAGSENLWADRVHEVLWRAGNSLGEGGMFAEAATYFQRLQATTTGRLGPDHPDTLTARAKAARWRGRAGDAATAVVAFEGVFADRLRVLGPDHPDTLNAQASIAYWRADAGDAAGAIVEFEEVLAVQLRVRGPDHRDTLNTRAQIAHQRGEAGDLAGAIAAFGELLAVQLRVLGPDDPETLTTRQNLASWQGDAGDAAGAIVAFEELLADRLRLLGSDHRDTLYTRATIAHWRGEAGDPAAAVTGLEEVHADQLRVLGPDHRDTLTARAVIADWQKQLSDGTSA
ncbi:tetratricopeptide repeat protein [Lentzea sp. NPDC058436]|uniref:tetratricopeptide repeat protein n=1 Tax=Lentzea sp. NPDC058436 TaxID=3346499 RepID=UPI003667BCD8